MNDCDVAWLSATELRARYAARELSPVEVTEALLTRIERINPSLNAIVTVTPDLALKQARAAERAYRDGEAGLLAGVPITIKDLTPTRGIRTSMGSLLDPDWIPDEDAPFVEDVYAAGAVLLGKTNTPELGWKGDSGNRVFGPTHNPWRHGKTAGGSSGGAGAAVAAGLGPLSQGSDGAGSIRIPAGFCGIFGIKPSYGLVPQYPASAVWDLSHMGPMTRTVADSALLLNVVARADARDRLSWSSGVDYLAACGGDIRGLRVAWMPGLEGATVAPGVMAPIERAARRFEELGCTVEDVNPDLPAAWPMLGAMWTAAMAGYFRGREAAVRDVLDPGLFAVVERGARIDGAELAEALNRRNDYYEAMRRFMEPYDLILTPTLPITAFDAGQDEPPRQNADDETPLDWTPYTYPFNLTGQPAATVPCGFADDGLPVGLQIVGRWHDDATVLRAAASFERAAPWADHRPPLERV
ncbi:MAG: amidase [Thermomicrobiales bacterium]|nr:amidase [Thermomicrobiales bacterium]